MRELDAAALFGACACCLNHIDAARGEEQRFPSTVLPGNNGMRFRVCTNLAGAITALGELLLTEPHGGRKGIIQLLWELKFKSDVECPDVIRKAAELFFASASKERRAAKARIRELESENDDLKRKLPAKSGG